MQGRRNQAIAPGTILSRSFDQNAMAHVVLPTEVAPRYAVDDIHTMVLSVAADGADPNVVPPPPGSYLAGANFGFAAFHSRHGVGQSLDIEIWTRSDSGGVWLRTQSFAGLDPYAELVVGTRFRDLYLRPINVVIGPGGPNIPIHVCLA